MPPLKHIPLSLISLIRDVVGAIAERLRADPARTAIAAAAGLALSAVIFFLVSERLHHTVDTVCVENCAFGADMREIYYGGTSGNYRTVDPRKHLLAALVYGAGTEALMAAGLAPPQAFLGVLAFLAAILGLLFFLLCLRIGASIALALAACLWLLSTNAVLPLITITETYVLTLAVMALALLAFFELEPHIGRRPGWTGVLAGIFAGGASLANTPAAAVVLVYVWLAWRRLEDRGSLTRSMFSVAVPCLLAVVLGISVSLLKDQGSLRWQANYAAQWASLGNFVDARLLADFAASVFAFEWASPFRAPKCRLIAADLAALLGNWRAIAALIGAYGLFGWAAWRHRRAELRQTLPGFALAIAALLAFYIYFNPWEVMLYAAQWQLLLIVLAVIALAGSRFAAPLVLIVAAAGILANDTVDWPRTDTYAQCCGLERSPPWQRE